MTETSNEVSGVNETNPDGVRITAPTNAKAADSQAAGALEEPVRRPGLAEKRS